MSAPPMICRRRYHSSHLSLQLKTKSHLFTTLTLGEHDIMLQSIWLEQDNERRFLFCSDDVVADVWCLTQRYGRIEARLMDTDVIYYP